MAYTAIDDPSAFFKVQLYTGDGNDDRTVTFDDTDTNMQPNLIIIKGRSFTDDHTVFDTARGVNKWMATNRTYASSDTADPNFGVKSFDSDGFTVGPWSALNGDTNTHVAWCWKESTTAGFDIVDYDGAGAANHAHSLSAVPKFMIVKRYSATESWFVYSGALGQAKVGYLNDSVAWGSGTNVWGGSDPTSSVFSIGSDSGISGSGDYVAYVWAEKQGFSKFGQYEGNGNVNGTYVYTGFRPAMIMIKNADASDSWRLFDNKRLGHNPDNNYVYPNATSTESTDDIMDIYANGFKLRKTDDVNAANTYVYMAWAEQPLVNSKGVPNNAR